MPECCLCDERCRSWDALGRHLAKAHATDCWPRCDEGMHHDPKIGSVCCWCGTWLWVDERTRRLGHGVVQTLGEHLAEHGGAAQHLIRHALGV